jgi:hypothetical protein
MAVRIQPGSGRPIGLRPRARSTSRRVIRRKVTCTVVSVMPNMLTSAGSASPWRSIQDDSASGLSASPPKTT